MSNDSRRRLIYVAAYEIVAALCVSGIFVLQGQDLIRALPMSIAVSAISAFWNYLWNTLFEAMERRFGWKGRPARLRVLQAVCFEGGLAAIVVPIMAWWFSISLVEALMAELAVLVFLLAFTFAFNWIFDRIVGLPESAR